MEFRPLVDGDLTVYLGWVNQHAIWEVDSVRPYQVQTPETFGNRWERFFNSGSTYIMVVDGREIGYVGLKSTKRMDSTGEFFIVIGEIDEWGKGHGTQAMAWIEEKARSLKYTRLVGRVLGNNKRALSFYGKLGFSVIREEEPEFERNGSKYRIVVIEKVLGAMT